MIFGLILGEIADYFVHKFYVFKLETQTSNLAKIYRPISFFAIRLRRNISFLNDVDIQKSLKNAIQSLIQILKGSFFVTPCIHHL